MTDFASPAVPTEPAELQQILARYRGSILSKSLWQLISTAVLYVACWYAMLQSLSVGYWLTLLLAIPTALMTTRLFMIQHDCGHASYFKSRGANASVGSVIGVLTLIPFAYWRKTHALHHASSGDLDHREFGDIDTLTVREYLSRPRLKRLMYRLYRHPAVLLLVGPTWQFVLKHRLPLDTPRAWKREWASVHWTNIGIAAVVGLMWWLVGLERFLLVQVPVTLLAGAIGVYLFYVQHQYEETYWRYHEKWDYYASALQGASLLVMPRVLQWCTANIGLHHIHHLASRIPNYRLPQCLAENPPLQRVTRLTLWQSVKTFRLTLWDEDARRLVGFRELREIRERITRELETGAAIMATKPGSVPANWR
jgi:acyl-lipid omega-6 desaturase (Delta-12 desaturase)